MSDADNTSEIDGKFYCSECGQEMPCETVRSAVPIEQLTRERCEAKVASGEWSKMPSGIDQNITDAINEMSMVELARLRRSATEKLKHDGGPCPHTIRYGKCDGCGEEIFDGGVTKFPARIVLGEGKPDLVYYEPSLQLYGPNGEHNGPNLELVEELHVDGCPRYRLVLERID